MSYTQKKFILVVGAGLSGAVIAERLARKKDYEVLVIDKRDHLGGNCFDYRDENNILVNQYGAHLFHTDDEKVWEYVNGFAKWKRWDHKVLGLIGNRLVNIPVNINTVNTLCNQDIKSPEEMLLWLKKNQVSYKKIRNSEEMSKSRVGQILYEKIFKPYTFKQWGKYPNELAPSVLARIPIRCDFNEKYFDDRFQALPEGGYSKLIKNILTHKNITVKLKCDFFRLKKKLNYSKLIFTGPIDHYFAQTGLPKLEYRSIKFVKETYKNMNYFQPNSVVNYLEAKNKFTRIVEYKHFLNQKSAHTTIVKEYTKSGGDPYYPVPNDKNQKLYKKYEKLALKEKDTIFLGRLANYKYFNMDQAIKNALDFFEKNQNLF